MVEGEGGRRRSKKERKDVSDVVPVGPSPDPNCPPFRSKDTYAHVRVCVYTLTV